jgi:hypothetical protein
MVEHGKFLGAPSDGKFVPRKLDAEIVNRPAV